MYLSLSLLYQNDFVHTFVGACCDLKVKQKPQESATRYHYLISETNQKGNARCLERRGMSEQQEREAFFSSHDETKSHHTLAARRGGGGKDSWEGKDPRNGEILTDFLKKNYVFAISPTPHGAPVYAPATTRIRKFTLIYGPLKLSLYQ